MHDAKLEAGLDRDAAQALAFANERSAARVR
jgi:hypothetical protein